MLSAIKFFLNPYDRKCRLQPALLCALPMFVSFYVLVPAFELIWSVIGALVVYCGGTTILTQLGRDLGKSLERKLYQRWGGKPSVSMLRHSDNRIGNTTKNRYRQFLERNVPGLKLASARDESLNPEQADEGYESATLWLLEQTRDREKFELLFRENMNYGFRRNVLALKPVALSIDAVMIFVIAYKIFSIWTESFAASIQAVGIGIWICAGGVALHLATYIILNAKWVRTVADAYAKQLLASCDVLANNP